MFHVSLIFRSNFDFVFCKNIAKLEENFASTLSRRPSSPESPAATLLVSQFTAVLRSGNTRRNNGSKYSHEDVFCLTALPPNFVYGQCFLGKR